MLLCIYLHMWSVPLPYCCHLFPIAPPTRYTPVPSWLCVFIPSLVKLSLLISLSHSLLSELLYTLPVFWNLAACCFGFCTSISLAVHLSLDIRLWFLPFDLDFCLFVVSDFAYVLIGFCPCMLRPHLSWSDSYLTPWHLEHSNITPSTWFLSNALVQVSYSLYNRHLEYSN